MRDWIDEVVDWQLNKPRGLRDFYIGPMLCVKNDFCNDDEAMTMEFDR